MNAVVPPPLINGSVTVDPRVRCAGQKFTITFSVDKPLAGLPEVTLQHEPDASPVCVQKGAFDYECTYTPTGLEYGGKAEQERLKLTALTAPLDVRLRDEAHNETTVRGAASLLFDFVEPSVTLWTIEYFPDSTNPLPVVSQAREGTRIRVTVIPNEPISTASAPALVARLSGSASETDEIHFDVIGSDSSSTRATFGKVVENEVLARQDGDYDPRVTLTDVAGNRSTVTLADPVRLKTKAPQLQVNQPLVTFLRSPWGNAAPEELRACEPPCPAAFTIPAGPYFALAPGDTLEPTASLASAAFTATGMDSRDVAALRIWADTDGKSLLAVVRPNRDDDRNVASWPRAPVHIDVPSIWATLLDNAGNESHPPVAIESTEWVATANRPAFASSPHAVDSSVYLTETLFPDLDTSNGVPAGLDGLDATTVELHAQPTFREIVFGPKPPARSSHAMAYDSARGLVVMFGGEDSTGKRLDDTWEWNGMVWANRTPTGTASPVARSGHGMVYDAARNRVVLYGGIDASGAKRADTWEWDGATWALVASGGGPGGRERHGMAYDTARRKVVLFGGAAGNRETWEWDGDLYEWTNRQPTTSPPARANFGMAFDSSRGCVVMFGGSGPNGHLADAWQYCRGVDWATLPGSPPPAREGHTLVYDAGTGHTICFGGETADAATFEWFPSDRTWHPVASAPVGSSRHAAAYDPRSARMLVFGGQQDVGESSTRLDSTLEFDGRTNVWTQRTPVAPPLDRPPAMAGGAMAFDPSRRRSVLFGGSASDGTYRTDVWEWDGIRWWNVQPALAPPLGAPAMAYQPYSKVTGRIVVFGGRTTGDPSNELWEWDGATWTQRPTSGGPPQKRNRAGLAYDALQNVLVLFGGNGYFPQFPFPEEPAPLNDTWELSGSPSAWTWTRRANPPPAGLTPRYGHALLPTESGAIAFFGALAGSQFSDQVWRWDAAPVAKSWTKLTVGTSPAARGLHVMTWDSVRGRALLFGGKSAQGELRDVWEWTGTEFVQRSPPANAVWPRARVESAMAFDSRRGRAVLFGGTSAGAKLDDLWEWDADLGPDGRQKRAPMVQLTVSYAGAWSTDSEVKGLRVRARAGGQFGAGTGAQLLGWRIGGSNVGPGQWVQLASTEDAFSLAMVPAGVMRWAASDTELPTFFVTRDALLAFQLRPGGAPLPAEKDAVLEADYLEVRIRYGPKG
ncbi:MAG TPA: kelch repeat-containing protein [Anaeromyxobacter sp.]|nr:kelch repeat-containing protein [Anaeromyxobacter sp.]